MTLLLVVIYVAFIGLGIPDSLFGSALSSIIEEFGLPLSASNLVSSLVSFCTVISSLFAARLLKRFGTAVVTIVSTAATALALLGYSASGSFFFMLLCAIPLGLGAGAIDASLNNFVALHFGGTHMNFLHCFYGVGVIVSPYLMSIMLQRATWREGYLAACILQAAIALVLLLSLPLWKKAGKGETAEDLSAVRTLSMKQMAGHAGVRWAWVLSFSSNAVEALTGIWGATYLIRTHALTADQGASAIILYYVGMTLGRFLSGVFADKLGSKGLIRLGIITLTVRLYAPATAEIIISDKGCGIENVRQAREPMFTTGGADRSGMGFTIMESFMDGMTVRSKPGKGTTVVLQKVLEARQEV